MLTNLEKNLEKAVREMMDRFSLVPGSVFEALARHDEDMIFFDSDQLRLLASPGKVAHCPECGDILDQVEVSCSEVDIGGELEIECSGCEAELVVDDLEISPKLPDSGGYPVAYSWLRSPNDCS